jgi:prepilin-type N-terminal cleavage/methylation domain-containing protein
MKICCRKGLTLVELLVSLSLLVLLMSILIFILLNPVESTLKRLNRTAQEIRLQEGLRQMQSDLFYAHQVTIAGSRVQGVLNDGQLFSYEDTPKGLKRILGQSTAYFTLPEDEPLHLSFKWVVPGLLEISASNINIQQKVH